MLSLLEYHLTTTNYFKQQKSVWNFFANHTHKEEQLKEFKTDLLKNTYKFDEASETELYKKVAFIKEKLSLSIPVVLYQAQNTEDTNASIVFVKGEAHIVFSGKLIQLMKDEELLAIIAHELSHVQLFTQLNGEVEITDRIITAISNHPGSTPAHYETARLFQLYNEIFCDRGAYIATNDYKSIISSLVKIATGLQTVNADSYIKQAEEIFTADESTKTSGVSHPENFIRARAIWLWHNKGNEADHAIRQMIQGFINLEELDLFSQQKIAGISEDLVKLLITPDWIKTPPVTALANQYFGNISLQEPVDTKKLGEQIENMHHNIHDYLSYILFDFATNDNTLEDVPLGYCFYLADELKLDKAFATTVKKEKKLTDKKITTLKKQSLSSFHKENKSIPTLN